MSFELDRRDVSGAYRRSEYAADVPSGLLAAVATTCRDHPDGAAERLMAEYQPTFEALAALDDDPDGFLKYGIVEIRHENVDPADLYRQLWPAGQWHTRLPSVQRSQTRAWQNDPYGHARGLPWIPADLVARAPFPAPTIRICGRRIPFPASRVVSIDSWGSWAGRFPNRTKHGEPSIDFIERYAHWPLDTLRAEVHLVVFVDAAGEHWAYGQVGGHHRAAAQRLRGDRWIYAASVEVHHPTVRPFVEFSVREMVESIAHWVARRGRVEAWADWLSRYRHRNPKRGYPERGRVLRERPWKWWGVDSWTDSGPWRAPRPVED